MEPHLRRILLGPNRSIRDTMRTIDEAGLGIALVVDSQSHLLGTVTDGDIRRAILRGVDLDEAISRVMHTNPLTVPATADAQAVRRVFRDSTLKQLPVVDATGRVLDLHLVNDFLSVALSNPDITDREIESVLEVLHTPNLSRGPKVAEFEERIAHCSSRRYAVAVSSGTAGLHLVVKSLGLGSGDEVITTPFSFIASSNCLLYENVRPIFVDIEPDTYNIDPNRIETAITSRTRAILPVDVFGQPARYDVIEQIASRHGLAVISDCCESIGAEYKGRRAGSFGAAGVFAFYPNKQITTGEGGAIVTDDEGMAVLLRSLRNQGRSENGGWLAHERLGYNYRLPEVNCALGIVQLERINEILAKRQRVADLYHALLKNVEEVHRPFIAPQVSRMSWFVYVIRLADRFSLADRGAVIQYLSSHAIGTNVYFPPIHLQPFYRERFGFAEEDYPITEAIAQRTIALPFHNHITEEVATAVVERLKNALASLSARSAVYPAAS
jgi:perosamine synthetase